MVKVGQTRPKRNSFYSGAGAYFVMMSSTTIPTPQSLQSAVASPCVKTCIVDGSSSLCLGCFRTLSEIGGWSGMTDAQRAAVMAELPVRAAQARP